MIPLKQSKQSPQGIVEPVAKHLSHDPVPIGVAPAGQEAVILLVVFKFHNKSVRESQIIFKSYWVWAAAISVAVLSKIRPPNPASKLPVSAPSKVI